MFFEGLFIDFEKAKPYFLNGGIMKRIACLIAIITIIAPYLPKPALAETTFMVSSPRTDTITQYQITFTQDKPIKKGDKIKISFQATESGKMPDYKVPECTYDQNSNRRFNPGPEFLARCKDNQNAQKFEKMYLTQYKPENPTLNQLKDFADSFIPGFLLPPLPKDPKQLEQAFGNIISKIYVMGMPCQPTPDTQLVNAIAERSVTISCPVNIDENTAQKGIYIVIGETFKLMCPATQGEYALEIATQGSTQKGKVSIFSPIVSDPVFTIDPPYPEETSTWTFSFKTGGGGALSIGSSSITLKLPKGFAKSQKETNWSIDLNGSYIVSSPNMRIAEYQNNEALIIMVPANIKESSQVKIALKNINNPKEIGPVECSVWTSSDNTPVDFPKQEIVFTQSVTSNPPDASFTATATVRLVSEGFFEGEEVMIVLPSSSSFLPGAELKINGNKCGRVNFGEKTAQLVLPFSIEKGSYMRISFEPVKNPQGSGEVVKLSIGQKTFEISWIVNKYETKFAVSCNPGTANTPCSMKFVIAPPENLAPEERQNIKIEGPWNRAMMPQDGEIPMLVNEIQKMATFEAGTISVNLEKPLENRETVTITIPQMAGFASPDKTGTFTATIGAEKLSSELVLAKAPPMVSYKFLSADGKIVKPNEKGWIIQPVKLVLLTSTGKADVRLKGFQKDEITSKEQDLSVEISESLISKGVVAYAKDERGESQAVPIPFSINVSPPKIKITSPEKTANQAFKLDVEVNIEYIRVTNDGYLAVWPKVTVGNIVTEMKTAVTDKIEDATFALSYDLSLAIGKNRIAVLAENQAGQKTTLESSVEYIYEQVNFDLPNDQPINLKQGQNKIKAKTNPGATVKIGDKEYKADSNGNLSITIGIEAGYNIIPVAVTTELGAKQSYQMILTGERIVTMVLNVPSMVIDGKATTLKVAPTNNFKNEKTVPSFYNGITFIPLRDIANVMFAEVAFDDKTKQVTLTQKRPGGNRIIKIKLGSPIAIIDGKETPLMKELLIAPVVIKGTSMVPLRFISESMGAQVGFEAPTKKITITWPDLTRLPENKSVIKIK